uniref:Uncharacterized protein n=1 Tax=Psilocybe cubensis TaxID=181762 RepID=A0A8H8CKM0_PSICU
MKVWNGEDKGFELRSPLYPPRPHFLANNKTPLKMKVWNGEDKGFELRSPLYCPFPHLKPTTPKGG